METLGDIPLIQVGKFQWVLRPCLVRKRVPGANRRANTDRLFLIDAQWHDLSRELVRYLETAAGQSVGDLLPRAVLIVLRNRGRFGYRTAMSIDKRLLWNLSALFNSAPPIPVPQLPTEPQPPAVPVPWYTKAKTWLLDLISEPVDR